MAANSDIDSPSFTAVTTVVKVMMPVTMEDADWTLRAEELMGAIQGAIAELASEEAQDYEAFYVNGVKLN